MNRLSRFFIIASAAFVLLSLPMRAQVTVSIKNMALKDALVEVERQSGYGFLFSNALADANALVNVEAEDRSIEYVMNQLLKGLDVSYEITKDKQIAITSRQKKETGALTRTDVTGHVRDEGGLPVVGAVVMVKGKLGSSGTMTDAEGAYSINAVPGTVLEFSCLGYESQTVEVGTDRVVDVVLYEDAVLLEETVVIGYGVQKKVNLTGSVASIDYSKAVDNRTIVSTSASLAGLAAGVSVTQSSGQPGSDGATIRIRGLGSFTTSSLSPLVLVDGVEWSMDNVNPNDIASISVLKDAASTAIYGTRAANGVILITTKNGGESRPQISYSYKGIIQMPYNHLHFVSDYATHMSLINEGCDNVGTSRIFSQSNIDKWAATRDNPMDLNEKGIPNYVAYPNTDWFDELFQVGYSQEHNISVIGGSRKIRYMVSGGFLDNEGVMGRFGIDSSTKKFHFRTNLDADITDWLTVGTKVYGLRQTYGLAGVSSAFNALYQTTPGVYVGTVNAWGSPALNSEESTNANNIMANLYGSGGYNNVTRLNATVYAKMHIKGFGLEVNGNYSPSFGERHSYSRPNGRWNYTDDVAASTSSLENAVSSFSTSRAYYLSMEVLGRYNKTFGNHTVGALLGYSNMTYETWGWGTSRKGGTDWSMNDLSTYSEHNSDSNSARAGWALQSFFGRVNYSYRDRYLFEANLRVDGSSKFGPKTRYGVFPSFSAGWRIDQEYFMGATKNWLSHLKLRASWGQTGNNAGIGNYAWQATYATAKLILDGAPTTGLYIASLSNDYLKWETTTTTDVGIDAGFFKDRLTAEIDYYYKNTSDILFTPDLYWTMGEVSGVPSNQGSLWNQGVEVALNWRNTIKRTFSYYVGVNFAYNKNKVTSFKGPLQKGWFDGKYMNNLSDASTTSGSGRLCEGYALGEHYLRRVYHGTGAGYKSGAVDVNAGPKDGMIRTETDMKWVQAMLDSGYSFNGCSSLSKGQLWYGDLLYEDRDGDKNYGDDDDMDFNGRTSTPSVNLGLNLGFTWKGLDLSMTWSGAFGFWIIWNSNYYNGSGVLNGYGLSERVANDHYFYDPSKTSDPRTNQNGTYPRLTYGVDLANRLPSEFYEYKGDYFKLKSLQIGYTLPQDLTRRIKIEKLRFFASGENLLTITPYIGLDPEKGSSIGYPLMRQVTVGGQITF